MVVEEEAVEVGVLRARDGDLVRTSRVVERSRVESRCGRNRWPVPSQQFACPPTGDDDKSRRYICARSDEHQWKKNLNSLCVSLSRKCNAAASN